MQKHPSPSNQRGDFHWHPADLAMSTRNRLAETLAGATHPAACWLIERDSLVWARTFVAVSPTDRRRYTGLAGTIASPAASFCWGTGLPRVLAGIELPDAAPWTRGAKGDIASVRAIPGFTTLAPIHFPTAAAAFSDQARDQLAPALVFGGQSPCTDPSSARLLAVVGELLAYLPPRERARPRTGAFSKARPGPHPTFDRSSSNLLHYLSAGWFSPRAIRERDPDFAAATWRLVHELGAALALDLEALFAELTQLADAWDTAERLGRHLVEMGALSESEIQKSAERAPAPLLHPGLSDAGRLWSRLLHYWGRGFFAAADELADRLAGVLAMRVVADHLFHLDSPDSPELPLRYVRRLRYETLLTRTHVTAMSKRLFGYLPTLSSAREVPSA